MTWLDVVFRKTTLTAVQRMSWRTGLSQGGPSGNTVEQDACNVLVMGTHSSRMVWAGKVTCGVWRGMLLSTPGIPFYTEEAAL